MAQRIQQGSILGFVLVGALLTALVIGGIVVVRKQLANTGSQKPGSSQVATNGTDQKPDTGKDESSSDNLKQAVEQQRAEEKKAQEQKAASEAQSNSSNTSTGSNGTTSTANNLPTTGPADAVWTVLGATMLAGAGMAYVRSRSLI